MLKTLDYDDPTGDYSDDLQLLLLEVHDEYPQARPMKSGIKF